MFTMLALKWATIPTKVKAGLGIALVIAIVLLLAYCSGRSDGKAGADLAREKANSKTITIDSRARENAATDRVVDAVTNLEVKKELSDAVAKLPDTMPSARRIALGCARLQRQGTDVSSIPACR